MTVDSMIHLIGGSFVALSVILGMYVHPYFLWFTVFVGLNLAQSAFTGWCPMMWLLRRLGVPDTPAVRRTVAHRRRETAQFRDDSATALRLP